MHSRRRLVCYHLAIWREGKAVINVEQVSLTFQAAQTASKNDQYKLNQDRSLDKPSPWAREPAAAGWEETKSESSLTGRDT